MPQRQTLWDSRHEDIKTGALNIKLFQHIFIRIVQSYFYIIHLLNLLELRQTKTKSTIIYAFENLLFIRTLMTRLRKVVFCMNEYKNTCHYSENFWCFTILKYDLNPQPERFAWANLFFKYSSSHYERLNEPLQYCNKQ